MRIVGGRLRGRRLTAPADSTTRPTSDRVRESLFNILESRHRDQLAGGRVGDLFAGTGALGIEALSRGAAHATFAEQSPDAFRILQGNIADLGLQHETTLVRGPARQAMQRSGPFDLLLLDPPYGGKAASDALSDVTTYNCIHAESAVILEIAAADRVDIPDTLYLTMDRLYGNTRLLFLVPGC